MSWFVAPPAEPVEIKFGEKIPWEVKGVRGYVLGNTFANTMMLKIIAANVLLCKVKGE